MGPKDQAVGPGSRTCRDTLTNPTGQMGETGLFYGTVWVEVRLTSERGSGAISPSSGPGHSKDPSSAVPWLRSPPVEPIALDRQCGKTFAHLVASALVAGIVNAGVDAGEAGLFPYGQALLAPLREG
jgi:hypothetical protein